MQRRPAREKVAILGPWFLLEHHTLGEHPWTLMRPHERDRAYAGTAPVAEQTSLDVDVLP